MTILPGIAVAGRTEMAAAGRNGNVVGVAATGNAAAAAGKVVGKGDAVVKSAEHLPV